MLRKNVFFTPQDFPNEVEFKILSLPHKDGILEKLFRKGHKESINNDIIFKLKNIIKKYRPNSKYLGHTKSYHLEKNQYHLLIFQPINLSDLLKIGWNKDKIILMPLPISDFWAYWNFDDKIFVDNDGLVSIDKCMNCKEFLQDLLDRKMTLPDENALKSIYPNKDGLKWRTELNVKGGGGNSILSLSFI